MRGFSLVELMVGIAVGMFVVAAAALMTSSQLTDNRRLLLETQLQQDLRAAADIVARDLRRSGYWAEARNGVPSPAGSTIAANPYGAVVTDSANATVRYAYRRGAGAEAFGFRLGSDGVLSACQGALSGACAWQALTDGTTVQITAFTIGTTRAGDRARSANAAEIVIPCPNLCTNADGTQDTLCWPKVGLREYVISITGHAVSDAAVTRTLDLSVRLRNDRIGLTPSSGVPVGEACPVT